MFDASRFLRLARAQFAEQWRTWGWFLGVGVIVHFVLMMLVLFADSRGHRGLHQELQAMILFAGFYLTAPIFAARYFQGMARRESAGIILMRPASAFEKWLLAAGVVLVAYPLAYALAFQVVNLPASLYAEVRLAAELAGGVAGPAFDYRGNQPVFGPLLPWQAFDGWREAVHVFLFVATLQGFGLLGSLYFRAMPFIKTVVAGFVLLLAVIFVVIVTDGRVETFLGWWEPDRVRPNDGLLPVLMPLAWCLVPGLVWLAALFALREREAA